MVARHEVEGPLGEAVPQLLPVAPLADRRGAFPGGGTVQDLLRGEREIVRARLGCDREPGTPRIVQPAERLGGRDMHNVNAAAGFATEPEHQVHRLELRGARA